MTTGLLSGRVALVTGGSRGIGAATARALARHGAAVAVNYVRNRAAADEVAAAIEAARSRALAVPADANDDAEVGQMVATVTDTLGAIVLIGASGTHQSSVRPEFAQIGLAKATLDALGRYLAAEPGLHGIRVNIVAPGLVPTDANDHEGREQIVTALGRAAPLGRVAEADDVADTVVAMVSDPTRHTTGAFVPVDGGATML